jgi:two-component system OmpR family response regulator/two-component system response regulator QseB
VNILIVEDDLLLLRGIADAMRRWNFTSTCAVDLSAASREWKRGAFDAVLLDLRLGHEDGLDFLRQLRAAGDTTPVIAVTARDAVADRIEGLDAGADDYLIKPFSLDELAARLRAVHRRAHGLAQGELVIGKLWLDSIDGDARYDGQSLELSRREFLVLRTLAKRAGRVVSRDTLERAVYGNEAVGSNALEVHIHSLRRKIGREAIRTVRGLGYMLSKSP